MAEKKKGGRQETTKRQEDVIDKAVKENSGLLGRAARASIERKKRLEEASKY